MRIASRPSYVRWLILLGFTGVLLTAAATKIAAQQTNPVDRKVTNPMTDTPNVNPLTQDQPITPRTPQKRGDTPQLTDTLTVDAQKTTETGKEQGNRIVVHEGNVDARIGTYRLQADKLTVYEATNKVVAEGNVVFDQGDQQRITGSRAEWNYKTKTGYFINSTGFTNQTQDGTRLYFTADRIERISLNTIVAENAQVTACDENVPKWSFHAKHVTVKTGDKVKLSSTSLHIKKVPVIYLPYASISIKHRDRASGFLTPTFGGSGSKGFRLSEAYYQTLGRSADVTLRGDIYTERGIGIGTDLRTRANSRSFFNAGFYYVKDRILGPNEDAEHPDQGGSSLYVEGVHYFPNGFTAVADVNVTSNLAFRQVFSDTIQQVISPEELSQVFVNKDHKDYSFNFLARAQVSSLSNARIRIREMPSVTIDKRPSPLSFFKKLPVYFSFEGGAEGVSRKETTDNLALFRLQVGRDPLISPSMVQRLDFHPRIEVPLTFDGWTVTTAAAGRVTFYSDSLDPVLQKVASRNLTRGYGEFEVDVRPPPLAKDYYRSGGAFFFRHLIEPYIIYRRVFGIDNFDRIIRFDYIEAVADTNEIEFGVANRFFTRRSTENVSSAARKKAFKEGDKETKGTQPYEALTITMRAKYFFDRTFGGALIGGQRNQFYPINTVSGFTYGGVPRAFSPLNLECAIVPVPICLSIIAPTSDTHGGGLRAMSATFGINRSWCRPFRPFTTRAVELVPSLAQFANVLGTEPGTLRGSQWSPSIFIGTREKGLYGGASIFFYFQYHPGQDASLVSSVGTVGYGWDCCAVTAQISTFNVGLRKENRVLFSFRLNGIGAFGTEQIGQRFH